MSLTGLPYEVLSIITEELDLEDIFNLGLTCPRLLYLIQDNRTCRGILETAASASAEAQDASATGDWARALRRVVQRRQAIRAAAPFTAAVVAVAESWLYADGVLCHVQDRFLRVLDLHRSAGDETVVDVRRLLRDAVAPEARGRRRLRFEVVHYADGLVSCLYSHPRPDVQGWLVVFDVRARRVVTTQALRSTYKLFVRNDNEYLYFGTHSELGEDGFRRWVLMGYDIKAKKWFDHKIHLMDMVGSDIGQSICFEIIDGYFYGLSNQTSFEIDEVDWTSYYHCFCFPVGSPQPKSTHRSVRDRMWRRQHAEGPIDDRWSFIRLIKNEEDGRLQILESRKEWLDRRSSGQRAYYTTDLDLAPLKADCDAEEAETAPGQGSTTTSNGNSSGTSNISGNINSNNSSSSSSSSSSRSSSSRSTIGPGGSSGGVGGGGGGGGRIILNPSRSAPSALASRTNDQLPPRTEVRLRDPYNTHTGDDASTALMFTLSKCPVRSYHQPSQTFLDLVDNPDPADPTCAPRLQLRAGARLAVPAAHLPRGSPAHDARLPHGERIRHLYAGGGANRIAFWPPSPADAPGLGGGAAADPRELELLGRVVCPPTHVGACRGAWDERSLVWSTGSNPDGLQAVVFVGFDPGVRLRGLRRWAGGGREGQGQGQGQGQGPAGASSGGAGEGKADSGVDGASTAQMGHAEDAAAAASAGTGGERRDPGSTMNATHGGCTEDAYAHGAGEEAQSETGKGKGKEVTAACEPAAAAAATFPPDTYDGGSPRSSYSWPEDDETAYSCSSPESTSEAGPQQPPYGDGSTSLAAQKRTPGSSCSWAWTEPAMYREIAFGYDHLPDFTKAREDFERRRDQSTAAAGSR